MAEAASAQDEATSSAKQNKTNQSDDTVQTEESAQDDQTRKATDQDKNAAAQSETVESEALNGQKENVQESEASQKEKKEETNEKDEKKQTRNRNDYKHQSGRHNNHHHGSKRDKSAILSTYDHLEESQDADEIRRQVEFYFADANLPGDKYLLGLTGGSNNKPVDLKIIHNFKRMRRFQPFSVVRDAVKASETLNLNESDEITRKTPLDSKFTSDPEKNRQIQEEDSISRSVYAKGFGKETTTTQIDIEEFFEPYGPLEAVRMRRADENGTFKGSVFVEFQTEDLAKQFLALEEKPKWFPKQDKPIDLEGEDKQSAEKETTADANAEGIDLLIMSKHEYNVTNPKDAKDAKNHNGSRFGNRGGRGGRARGGRGGRGGQRGKDRDQRRNNRSDDTDWKARRDREQADDKLQYDDAASNDNASKSNGTTNGQEKHVDENAGAASAAPEKEPNNKRKHDENTAEQDASKKAKTGDEK